MSLLYAQGTDVPMLLHDFVGFALLPGDTVRGQFRYALSDSAALTEIGTDPLGTTAAVDVTAQTILITIPEAVNTLWTPKTLNFMVYTTLLVISSTGLHRLAIEIAAEWRASYTRGVGV